MREIIFRGKRKDNGEWVEGYYVCLNGKEHRIYSDYAETDCGDYYPDCYSVIPETVGAYTGLTDKNGKKIFEGDIVKRELTLYHSEKKRTRETQIGVVTYSDIDCGFYLEKACNLRKPWDGDTLEIIGNIHDNPELLKGGVGNG